MTLLALCIATLLVAAGVNIAGPGEKTDRPRYTMPKNGRPWRVEIEQYFQMSNPVEAGKLLLTDATGAGIDVDWKPAEQALPEILLQSGVLKIEGRDRSFLKTRRFAQMAGSDSGAICVLRFSRGLTLREVAEIMGAGIRIYKGVAYYSFIARVPSSSVVFLNGLDALEWVGEYRADYKYDLNTPYSRVSDACVYSLIGDSAQCRQELARFGVKVEGFHETTYLAYRYEFYSSSLHPDSIPRIASIWWVQKIQQMPPVSSD